MWDDSWSAIKAVWASKWNERAVSSMRKSKLDHTALRMAVLCQAVVPATYAFVSHTRHPTTGATVTCPDGRDASKVETAPFIFCITLYISPKEDCIQRIIRLLGFKIAILNCTTVIHSTTKQSF